MSSWNCSMVTILVRVLQGLNLHYLVHLQTCHTTNYSIHSLTVRTYLSSISKISMPSSSKNCRSAWQLSLIAATVCANGESLICASPSSTSLHNTPINWTSCKTLSNSSMSLAVSQKPSTGSNRMLNSYFWVALITASGNAYIDNQDIYYVSLVMRGHLWLCY